VTPRPVGSHPTDVTADWLVIRQDDNGNETVLAEVATEAQARAVAAAFEARAHKQMYTVVARALYEQTRPIAR
jgi:hypothetical protein